MSSDHQTLLETIEHLTQCQTAPSAFDHLVEYASRHNLEKIMIGRLYKPSITDGVRGGFHMSTYSKDWVQTYLSQNYLRIDPVVIMGMMTSLPFKYADAYKNLTPAQERFVEDSRRHGMNDAFVIPIHTMGKAPGFVVYASYTPFDLSPMQHMQLVMMGMTAFTHIEQFFDAVPIKAKQAALKQRERDILSLVAKGKTNWEVGHILDISEYSVRDYMKALSRRLETSNRTHTVIKALELGLIHI